MSLKNDLEKIFILVEKSLPKSNILNCLMMLLRVIPLFLVTHDWNIHYHNSITYSFSYYTTLPFIHKKNAQKISIVIISILFIYSIINIFIYLNFYKQIKEFNKISNKKIFKYGIQIMFWVNFIFAPYNFMFCTVNYFCPPIYEENESYKLIKKFNNNCRDIGNILIMIIQSILIIYLFIINIFFSSVTAKPCCITSSLITTKLNEIKFKLAFFPFFQTILVLDYYLPLNICVIIKGIVRALYVWYYISFILREANNYFTNLTYRLTIIFIDSMCFFSCIIEYIALLDYKNNFRYLQKNNTIIVFKLMIEVTLSFVVIQLFCINEKRITLQVFEGKVSNKYSYELLNKIFYIFSHPEKKFGTDLLYEIIENFDIIFKTHKNQNKCKNYPGIKCYCTKYTYNDFVKQSENYLEIVNNIRIGIRYNHKILKKNFPIMYKYIENIIKIKLIQNKDNYNHENFLLVLAFFYIIFDNNYNKGLFYLEEFSTTKFYQSNLLIQFQFKLIKLVILENYQNYLIYSPDKKEQAISENSFKGIYKIYSKIIEIIIIENYLSNCLDVYIYSLNYLKENDCNYYEVIKIMKNFLKSLKKMNKSLINLFFNNIITSYHLCAKLTIFYSFFYLEMPKNINKCFKNIFEITCKYENYSIIIANLIIHNNVRKFIIEYASDNFCSDIGYTLKEIKNKEINEYNPQSLKKAYDFNAIEKVRKGNKKIILREVIILNKEKHSILYDFIGIIVFDGNKLQIFFKVYPFNFHSVNNYLLNSKTKNNKRKNKKKDNDNKEECYAFINKNGKIFAISKLFEEYFCLNLNSIKKYKINLFKDILKIEGLENKDYIKKNLAQVYENIAIINFNLMQNSSNEEFTKTYKQIKEIQKNVLKNLNSYLICSIEKREMKKSEKEMKYYYFICFNIQINNVYTVFEKILGKPQNQGQYIIFLSRTKIGDFVSSLSNKKKKGLPNKFEINKNQNETLIKIRQIQILTAKQLLLNYNIKLNYILDLTLKETEEFNSYNNIVEKETNRLFSNNSSSSPSSQLNSNKNKNLNDSIDNYNKFFRNRAIDEPYSLIKKKNYGYYLKIEIYLLILVWILLTFVQIYFQIAIIVLTDQQNTKIKTLTSILINSLMSRNILYSFITTLICMQYVVNGLHNDTVIDNGFVNTIPFHKLRIYDRIYDFLYYFKQFERQEKILCDYNEYKVINIFFEELDYINVKVDNLTIKSSLNYILSNSHLHAYEVIESEIEPFLFNVSYYTIENRELLGESAFFQFVFDNYFTNGKYTWDEIDNLIYHSVIISSKSFLKKVYIMSIISVILVCCFFMIQFFFFNQFNNEIYAKYYLNYNYLQFFNTLLLKKAELIKEFISNTNIEKLYKFSQFKVGYENNIEDNNVFKNNYLRINNKLPLIIKPYKIKESPTNELIKLGINKSNSIYISPTFKQSTIEEKKFTLTPAGLTINKNNVNLSPDLHVKEPILEGNENLINTTSTMKKVKKIRKNKKESSKYLGNAINNKLIDEISLDNSLNLLTEYNKINAKKDLTKPKQHILYLIFFFMSIIFLTIFFIINCLIIEKTINIKKVFSYMIKNPCELINNTMEIVLIYAIILLKGATIKFDYTSNGYLTLFKELDYLNKIKTHNIIEETFRKIELKKQKVNDIMIKQKDKFEIFYNYILNLNKEGACDYYINFYFNNKDNYDFSFLNAFNYEPTELMNECYNLSYGINSKGITLATDGLLSSIQSQYYEFEDDENKGDNLLKRANNEKFIGALLQIDLIYDKLLINLVICWNNDYNKIKNRFDTINYFISIVMIALIFFIFTIYLFLFPIKTLKENRIINQVEACYYNTIMF